MHDLTKEEYKKISPNMTREDFITWINNDEPII
jgi:hypothetical protein